MDNKIGFENRETDNLLLPQHRNVLFKNPRVRIITHFNLKRNSLPTHIFITTPWPIQRLPKLLCQSLGIALDIPYSSIGFILQIDVHSVAISLDAAEIIDIDDIVLSAGKEGVIFEVELVGEGHICCSYYVGAQKVVD